MMPSNKKEVATFKQENTNAMAIILNHLLKEMGVSQRELARKSGITQAAISEIATGKSDPSISTLQKIADTLDVSVRDLFSGKDENVIICPHCGGKIRLSKG